MFNKISDLIHLRRPSYSQHSVCKWIFVVRAAVRHSAVSDTLLRTW
jgi:hypothetical protein